MRFAQVPNRFSAIALPSHLILLFSIPSAHVCRNSCSACACAAGSVENDVPPRRRRISIGSLFRKSVRYSLNMRPQAFGGPGQCSGEIAGTANCPRRLCRPDNSRLTAKNQPMLWVTSSRQSVWSLRNKYSWSHRPLPSDQVSRPD